MTENRTHKASASEQYIINKRWTYDGSGRIKDHFTSLNGVETKISNQNYNYRDEMTEKNLGAAVASGINTYLQSLDYSYNDQGWLTKINQATLGGTNIVFPTSCTPSMPNPGVYTPGADPDPNDLFYLELNYDGNTTGITGLPTNVQKSGNIGQSAWRVRGRDRQAYNYSYDYLNRMTGATYYDVSASNVATVSNRYNETLTYDRRGNILTLNRTGYYADAGSCLYNTIDNLTYNYTANTNKLISITDASATAPKPKGFNPGTGGAGFGYDLVGNLKSDTYKGITDITYNYLNLPESIVWGTTKSILFTYDASGTKLSKTVKTGATINLIQDYVSGVEYNSPSGINRKIEAIYHDEGRYFNTSATSTPAWRTEYSIKDHLGNSRISFTDKNLNGKIDVDNTANNEILQESHYYAFGMTYDGAWQMNDAAKDNYYLYNSKELNLDHGLNWSDYGARWYDACVGRFNVIDAWQEKYSSWSPYNYTMDNPIRFTDPSGNGPEDIIIRGQTWKPGATATGDDEFTNKVFNALNSLYENIKTSGAGNVKTNEASGNVIMDFVGEGSPDVEIKEAPEGGLNDGGSYADENGKTIYWNSAQGIEVNPNKTGTNVPGKISSETLLAHEFGHAWLAQFSPNLNSKFEALDSNESKTGDKNGLDPFEHNSFILPKVENGFSKARGEGVRTEYRGTSTIQNERTLQKATGLKRNINFDYRIK